MTDNEAESGFREALPRFFELLRAAFWRWYADNTFRLGAALAYYTVFSLAPIILIVVGIAGLVFGEEAARARLLEEIDNTVGSQVGEAIAATSQHIQDTESGLWATIISVVMLFFGATGVFAQLQDALNVIWGVKPREDRTWFDSVKDRFWSFSVVLGIGFLLLVSLVISTLLSALTRFVTPTMIPGNIYVWQVLNWLVSFGVVTLLFAMIFKLLPDAKIEWREVWVGAAVTAALFAIGRYLIGLYLGQSAWISGYGAAGSLVVILLWVYYSSQILLFGAEFTYVYANRDGKPLVLKETAEPVTEEARARQGMPRTLERPAVDAGELSKNSEIR
jgi:membrane protein